VLNTPTYALSAELWADSTRQVLDDAGIPQPWKLYQCPPYGLVANDKITLPMQSVFLPRQALLYLALHGLHRRASWWGHPKHLSPWQEHELLRKASMIDHGLVATAAPEGSVVCAAVCQAAYLFGKHFDSSLALRFIEAGVLGFIGPTMIVYEYVPDHLGPLDGIDRLFADVLNGLLDNIPMGQALAEAKRAHRLLDPPDEKNVHSLVLYGDPGLTIKLEEP
jgi:hypothetical protein